jgi:hypothetical protein
VFLPEMLSSTTGDSHGKQNRFQKNRLFQQTQLFVGNLTYRLFSEWPSKRAQDVLK